MTSLHACSISTIFILLVYVSWGDLLGLVSYSQAPDRATQISMRFDDANKISAIDKISTKGGDIERKIYFFSAGNYLDGRVSELSYHIKCYESIIADYFTLDDVMTPVTYSVEMSRVLSIFFSGSSVGENITRIKNTLTSDYWSMKIIAYNKIPYDLSQYASFCNKTY